MDEEQKPVDAGRDEKRAKQWRSRIEKARKARKTYEKKWQDNVAYRVMEPYTDKSENDRAVTPDDWSRTRAKIASLFSAVPTIAASPLHPQYAAAAPIIAKEINHILKHQAKPNVVMRECMPDLVNAAGLCAAIVRYEATFTKEEVPAIDMSMVPPEQATMLLQSQQVPMEQVDVAVSERFVMRRISPTCLLWPAEFKGSNFNDGDYIGHEGSLPWAVAKREFKLEDEDKDRVVGDAKQLASLSEDDEVAEGVVTYQEIFYWAARFDANEKYLDKIRRIVFVDGIEDRPVIDEDYAGQQFNEKARTYIGVCIFPIQVCTLAYVSDTAVPPSDSEVGRPLVVEKMRGRSQIMAQREASQPMRWADSSRVDPQVIDQINKGEWQRVIPMQGSGERALGEVARASYPHEDFTFDQIINRDLDDAWSLSQNQLGNFNTGARSASEANIVAGANAERIGLERAQVVEFFLSLVDVLAGLMQLFYDERDAEPVIGQDGVERLQAWDKSSIAGKFAFEITQDSTVLLSSDQKVEKLMKALNLVGKSGYVNPEPIIAEILALSGVDPAKVMITPEPPKPAEPNVSLRLTGAEDLSNPMAVALLLKGGQLDPNMIQQARQLIMSLMTMMPPPVAPGPMMDPTQPQTGAAATPDDWGPAERVTKRVEEIGG
jgi:hypothetical protein